MLSVFTQLRDPMAVVTAYLPPCDVVSLRRTCKQFYKELSYEVQFAAISANTCYSDDVCHLIIEELTQYANNVVKGFRCGEIEDIQAYIDSSREALLSECERVVGDNCAHLAELKEQKMSLDKKHDEDNQCESKKLRGSEWANWYKNNSNEIQQKIIKVQEHSHYIRHIKSIKLELLSLVHLVLVNNISDLQPFSEIPYEQKLTDTYKRRIESEVKEHGAKALDHAISCAQMQLNSRAYLVPFIPAQDIISSYLKQLGNSLRTTAQEKHLFEPRPRIFWLRDFLSTW
jgi:hypothetical protein